MLRAAVLAAWVGLVACTGGASGHKPDKPLTADDARAGSASVNKKPLDDAGGTFVRGAAVTPKDQLLAWLGQQVRDGEARLIRIPVVLKRGVTGFSTNGATIGGAADAVEIFINDAGLGIGLADRARTLCKDAPTCAMWLEGYWRGDQDGFLTFDAMKVGDPIAADALGSATHAEVEGESGN